MGFEKKPILILLTPMATDNGAKLAQLEWFSQEITQSIAINDAWTHAHPKYRKPSKTLKRT